MRRYFQVLASMFYVIEGSVKNTYIIYGDCAFVGHTWVDESRNKMFIQMRYLTLLFVGGVSFRLR